ncbi:hypothetical protein J4558_26785 [Leptolyngbya sp. 15MV]|nr:hypothetical protein J4558_26785 [Leptolyngbya sp. 15MV]
MARPMAEATEGCEGLDRPRVPEGRTQDEAGLKSAETAMARGPAGPYSRASDWPNSPTTGAPAAAARCISPESLPR